MIERGGASEGSVATGRCRQHAAFGGELELLAAEMFEALADDGDLIIAIQQRLHEDDLAGYLLAKGNFTHLELKAIAEEGERHALGHGRIYPRRKGEALFPAREPLATLAEILAHPARTAECAH